ncbi:MAG: beta-ketoacyl synthase N-terminal-like domain-containing protein [Candidatus Hodarchaeota archaeon]
MENKRRVVVTGIGVVSSVGNSVPQFWNSLKTGRDGIRPITFFDTSPLRPMILGLADNSCYRRGSDLQNRL